MKRSTKTNIERQHGGWPSNRSSTDEEKFKKKEIVIVETDPRHIEM